MNLNDHFDGARNVVVIYDVLLLNAAFAFEIATDVGDGLVVADP